MTFKKDIEKELMISEIEKLTEDTIKPYILETITIKDHNCYLCYLGESFGYSILVFKNGKHIYHANDYELHHRHLVKEKGRNALREYYINEMNEKLYTDAEMMEEPSSYDEYEKKSYFLRNYHIMRYEHETIFFIGTDAERENRQKRIEKNYPYYNSVSFCYVSDPEIVNTQKKYLAILRNAYKRFQNDSEIFREMVRKELANHEACVTCDYTDALDALGLTFEELTEEKQKIVREELKRQIESY